jgi:hypothetical protein
LTLGAKASAITIFLNNPHKIRRNPSSAWVSLNFLLVSICGNKFEARSIGPATNCGKKETKAATPIKCLVGLSLPL